jgi:acyl carrier protein
MLHGNGRTVSDMRYAATEIQSEIDEWFELYIEQETENRVQTLFSEGGWELNYLPSNPDHEEYEYNGYCQFPTKDEIRNLLVNWSSEWDDTPSLPRRDDFSDLRKLCKTPPAVCLM